MGQVQLRLSQKTIEEIDKWVAEGRFKNRSDAIKSIITLYQEREKTCSLFNLLLKQSEDVRQHPETLVPIEELE